MYEPLREPFVQVRVCTAQVAGSNTEDCLYAVIELPLGMLPPQGSVQLAGAATVTVTEAGGDCPAAFVQYSVYTCVDVRFCITWRPPQVFFVPDHAPPAVHEVAFHEDHERNVLPPDETAVGFARRKTVGEPAMTAKGIGSYV